MPDLILYLVKLSLGLAAIYLFYWLMLRKLTFYQWNRWYLLGYSVCCFFLPLVNIHWWLDPADHGMVLLQYIPVMGQWQAGSDTPVVSTFNWQDTIPYVFYSGMALMMARLLVQYLSLLRISRTASLLVDDDVKLYEVKDRIIPFSFGNSVYINSSLHSEEELKEIIRHEMVHVRQRHTIDIIWSELLVVVNWFNPFAWLIRKAIRQNLEFLADRQVLEAGLDRKAYQYLLLKVVGQQQFSIASHLNFSALKTRIAMMNKIKSARVHLVKFSFALPVAAVLLLAFRDQQDDSQGRGLSQALATDTLPSHSWVNEKGFRLSVADNQGECIVIIKDTQGKLVKAMELNEWNKNKTAMVAKYGELPPPPPPPVPPAPPAAISPAAPVTHAGLIAPPPHPAHPAPPAHPSGISPMHGDHGAPPPPPPPPPAPRLPKELEGKVSWIDISHQQVTIRYKDGKVEKYDLDNPAQKAALDKKFGKTLTARLPQNMEMSISGESKPGEPVQVIIKGSQSGNLQSSDSNLPQPGPVYFIEGEEASPEKVKALDPNAIESINVLKGEKATGAYGEKGRNGVVEIKLKKAYGGQGQTVDL
ncbi:hypothetical protein KJS94_01340 [Flavihumibacter rivuli]|uniref:M56 family metallopeptidase n=1 Tax=Flavihumibacter rivuli TaxID=2838156 RepID=UPI001BDF5FBA|nr:M56 family metallopeptidase [Flavihumibacter rivuli]ULQ56839.1 hypothetical protein KJS94_01340 [Flavihumibacter rivuli]